MENIWLIKLKSDDKTPAGKWRESQYHHKVIDAKKYNVGIPCGSINNIFVLDIDIKDNGFEEFSKFRASYGEPDTLTVKTPSGGRHYYFNLKSNSNDENINYIIKEVCYTRSKIGGVGIDIRSNGGYIVAPPSSIQGIKYEIINATSINNISPELASYLLRLDINYKMSRQIHSEISAETEISTQTRKSRDNEKITDKIRKTTDSHYVHNYKYELDDAALTKLLQMLKPEYLDNFELWFKITTILKGLNAVRVWKEWSKTSSNYNSSKNKKYWNLADPFLDINYHLHFEERWEQSELHS